MDFLHQIKAAILFLALGASTLDLAQGRLNLTSVQPLGPDLKSPPVLGDPTYALKATWTAAGQIHPYRVRFQMANRSFELAQSGEPGTFEAYAKFPMPLDGQIPIQVTLDSENRSGNTDPASAHYSGTFEPIAPQTPLEYYDPKSVSARQTVQTSIQGSLLKYELIFGRPSSETNQLVTELDPPRDSIQINAGPFDQKLCRVDSGPLNTGTLTADQTIKATVSNCRLNANKIQDTWSSLRNLPEVFQAYTKPDPHVQSLSPTIIDFVKKALPSDFEKTLSPIQAARKLFQAVEGGVHYSLVCPETAVGVLGSERGDCAGMSKLYLACLRNIGIPGRLVVGWMKGVDQWHVWTEIYLPSVGWIPQDVTFGQAAAPDGSFAYYFGCIPKLNERIRVGTSYTATDGTWTDGPQRGVTHFWWSGDAPTVTTVSHCSLSE